MMETLTNLGFWLAVGGVGLVLALVFIVAFEYFGWGEDD